MADDAKDEKQTMKKWQKKSLQHAYWQLTQESFTK